jgi:hypothetical protein
MLRLAAIVCLCPLTLLVGCGNQRTQPPNFTRSATPTGWRTIQIPDEPLSIAVPRNWGVSSGGTRLVLAMFSGLSIVEVWRYPRSEPLPTTPAQLRPAKDALVEAVQTREPHPHVIRSRVIAVAGAPAIELSVIETIGGQLRRDRSLHVFIKGMEVVLEASAPVSEFHAVDHAVFSPIKRSLRLIGT